MVLSLILALFVISLPQAQPATAASANIWNGRNQEFEDFLKSAKVIKVEELKIGVTHPRRAYVEPGGLASSFAWKQLPPGRLSGYWESYKSEIGAYELDKYLGLNMVPPTVERQVKNETGAAILWLDGVRSWEAVLPLPKPANWGQQLARMKMFDDLIGNSDRNKGNLLVDSAWNLYLIDHSRAFVTDDKLPAALEHVDRRMWDRMLALDESTAKAAVGQWLDGRQIKSMLQRRDKMKKAIDALVAKNGQSVFF